MNTDPRTIMTPYREYSDSTGSNGFPQQQQQQYPDPLEVTRTTSNNSMGSSIPDSPTNSRLSAAAAVSECDYDTNPTFLYQAIEAKQWDYAISLFTNRGSCTSTSTSKNDEDIELVDGEEASATWVVRKECNGKLRWRLLPLHAAVIFGSPLKLIELLLADYPLAAQCKDDRGMLPLHLAFRHQASWDIIDELLTTYPLAVFVSDRKGRPPLKCRLAKSFPLPQNNDNHNHGGSGVSSSNKNKHKHNNGSESALSNSNNSDTSSAFRTVAGVLELYSQIAVSGERKRVEQETRNLAQNSIAQIRDSHHRSLEAIRKSTESNKTEAKQKTDQLETEKLQLQERLEELEQKLAERDQSHTDMTKKLQLMNVQLSLANERAEEATQANANANANANINANASSTNNLLDNSNSTSTSTNTHTNHQTNSSTANNKSVDKMLRMMAETMVKQQKIYHGHVNELLTSYQEMVTEREAMRFILMKDSKVQYEQQKESILLQSYRKWFHEEGEKLSQQERSLAISPHSLSMPQPSSSPVEKCSTSPTTPCITATATAATAAAATTPPAVATVAATTPPPAVAATTTPILSDNEKHSKEEPV
mmetsp:Transcript_4419/g.9591  ORF Transcript_4419/g.9591 Transcript_4419/m.9591 type:complete len:593 (+) Transcript_4419:231-2009(+)